MHDLKFDTVYMLIIKTPEKRDCNLDNMENTEATQTNPLFFVFMYQCCTYSPETTHWKLQKYNIWCPQSVEQMNGWTDSQANGYMEGNNSIVSLFSLRKAEVYNTSNACFIHLMTWIPGILHEVSSD